jgi:hypothetical protein
MNKKGAEKIISVYWFIILILVAGGIYGMVYVFYDHPYDIRELEANILINNIADCISQKGVIDNQIFNATSGDVDENFKNNFLDVCKINFKVENEFDWNKNEQYYIGVSFYSVENLDKPFSIISKGNTKLVSDCDIKDKKVFGILSKCVKKRFYSVTKENKQILIDVLSIVRKTEKNVKL